MARKKLGEMLVEAGVLSEQGLRHALGEQRRWGGTLGRTVVDMKLVSEADLVRVLAQQLSLPTVDLEHLDIHPSVLELVPADFAQEHALVPFAQPMKFLDVAMADPTNLGVLEELRIRTQLNIRPYLAGPRMIEKALGTHYGVGFARFASRPEVAIPIDVGETVPPPRSRHDTGRVVRGGLLEPLAPARPAAPAARDLEIEALQSRMSTLEALVQRDEEVLRKLLALLVEKGVATREEILERIR